MFDIDIYKEIWQTISRNKMRSFLTGFGVAWGVFMFVVMLGIGNGFNNGMQQNVDGISQNSMFVFSNATTVEYKGFNPGRFWSMNNEDIDILQENIPEIEYISGMMFSNQGGNTVREERSENYNFRGVDHNHTKIEKLNVLQGRTFNYLDIKEKRKNCIIGKQVYEQLFKPGETAIGEQLSVNGLYYIVIGVVNGSENMNIGGDANTSVFIPLSTMQQVNNAGNDIHMIGITAYDDVNIKNIEQRHLAIAEAVDAKLGFYECPVPRSFHLSPSLVGKLAHTGRFYAFKETASDLERHKEHLRAAAGTPLCLLQSNTFLVLDSTRAGATGSMTIGAIWVPDMVARVLEVALSTDPAVMQEAERLHGILCTMKLAQRYVHPWGVRYLMAMRGLPISTLGRSGFRAPDSDTVLGLNYAARLWFDEQGELKV